jgi:N-acyl amino acid synthase FeeM
MAAAPEVFRIRLADTHGQRTAASLLINKMYGWRGYGSAFFLEEDPNRMTLVAWGSNEKVIGTLTLAFDSELGLAVDDLYGRDIAPIRDRGRRLCEFTRLAVDNSVRSKRILAALFHIAFIYAHKIHGHTDLFIEINPRHVKFYERMLGFRQFGKQKYKATVRAPAVLLWLDLAYAQRQIQLFGGQSDWVTEKSLYPYFFSPAEEAGIARRLRLPMEPAMPAREFRQVSAANSRLF